MSNVSLLTMKKELWERKRLEARKKRGPEEEEKLMENS